MRIKELIVYRIDEKETILNDMAYIMDRVQNGVKQEEIEKLRDSFYQCMQGLLELAGNHGFS